MASTVTTPKYVSTLPLDNSRIPTADLTQQQGSAAFSPLLPGSPAMVPQAPVFACLIAANRAANSMMRDVKLHGCDHHKQYIHSRERGLIFPEDDPEASDIGDATSSNSLDFDSSDDENIMPEILMCYVFSLEVRRPLDPGQGWLFGSGVPKREEFVNMGVDLMMSDCKDERMGYFVFHPVGAQLYIHARHSGIEMNGSRLKKSEWRLVQEDAKIRIGQYRFRFRWEVNNEHDFIRSKMNYLASFNAAISTPFVSTAATPSPNDITIGDWLVHGAVGSTGRNAVFAATKLKGVQVCAIKRVSGKSRKNDHANLISKYQQMATDLGVHQYGRYVMQLRQVLIWDQNADELWLRLDPLARGDFTALQSNGDYFDTEPKLKLDFFVQVLLGLKALHDGGWAHRDIKPANLGIVSWVPPRAVILDLDFALAGDVDGCFPNLGRCGTPGYIAPELEGNPETTYGKPADIWSMGATALVLFKTGRLPWRVEDRMFHCGSRKGSDEALEVYDGTLTDLENSEDPLENLIGIMLQEHAKDRMPIEEILEHPAIADVVKEVQSREARTGEKRIR